MDDKQSEPTSIRELLATFHHAITAQELARILRVKPDMVYKQARSGVIPHIRFGTAVRFDPKEIAEWIDHQRIGSRHRRKS